MVEEPNSTEGSVHALGRSLAARGALVYNTANAVVGTAKRYWTGREGDRYAHTEGASGVTAPVLELEEGHTFLYNEAAFIELSPVEAVFYEGFQQVLAEHLKLGMEAAAVANVPARTALILLTSMLRQQAALLDARMPPAGS